MSERLRAEKEAWEGTARERYFEMQRLRAINADLLEACEQNKTQWEGMVLALKTHGTHINVAFFHEHFQFQINANQAAIAKATDPVVQETENGKG